MNQKSPPDCVLLIADLHLDPAREDLTRAFLDFLNHTAPGAAALYILGDLFNVWIGDDDDTPLYHDISQALLALSRSGTAVYLMHGNRDFLLGSAYAAAAGAELISEPYVLEHRGRRYLLMHGDILCTRDSDYMAFRKLVRDPVWQQAFLAQPLQARREFAAQARTKSKSMSSNKPQDIMDVTGSEVEKLMQRYGIDTLIHGHTHRPAVHEFSVGDTPCRRIVLSDWDNAEKEKYLRLD